MADDDPFVGGGEALHEVRNADARGRAPLGPNTLSDGSTFGQAIYGRLRQMMASSQVRSMRLETDNQLARRDACRPSLH